MKEAEKQNIISELKTLHKELKSYKRLLDLDNQLTESQKRYRDSLREKLVRNTGKLKETITKLTGKLTYTQFGTAREIWAEGLRAGGYRPSVLTSLNFCIDVANEAIGKLESTPITELGPQKTSILESSKAFIAHEGETEQLRKLKDFLDALGIKYFIAEAEASDGRSIEKQVDWTQSKADFAICLATKGKAINKKTGRHYMAPNIIDELGRARQVFGNKIILLVQKGVEVHTNIKEIVYETFTTTNMEGAFIKITKELRNWGFIRTGKIEEQI